MTRLPWKLCTVLWYLHVQFPQFPPKTAKNEVPKEHVLCQNLLLSHLPAVPRNDTNVSSFRTERKRFQDRFVFQAKTRGRRTSHGFLSTTNIHYQNSKNLFCFRWPISLFQLSKQNFFQARTFVDSFIIAVCCCLSFCC